MLDYRTASSRPLPHSPQALSAEVLTPRSILEAFLDDCQFRGLAETTIAGYAKRTRPFVATLEAWPPEPAEIQRFILGLERASRRTRINYWQSIKSLTGFAARTFGTNDPTQRLRSPQRPKQTLHVLSDAQASAMFTAARSWRERTILLLVLGAGLRVGEVALLRPEDIGAQYVNIPGGKTGQRFVVTPPLLAEEVAVLRGDPGDGRTWLFPNPEGGHIRPAQVTRTYGAIAARAGVPAGRLRWAHSGRHYYATRVAEGGVPVFALQRQLGHSSPTTTSIYAHHGIGAFADQLRAASPAMAFPAPRQLTLDAALLPDVPAATTIEVDADRAYRAPVIRSRLFRHFDAAGTALDPDVELIDHGLSLRGLARAIGVTWGTLAGVRAGRWGVGEKFIRGAVAYFAGRYTEEELFYRVEVQA